MARLVYVVLLSALAARVTLARADALPPSSQRYELEATLDPFAARVHGSVRIHFQNHATRSLDALLFHLYLNAFADRGTVFMRESGGAMRGVRAQGEGSIELETLTVDGSDVLARAERELVPGDRTQLRVPLDTPLAAGASLVIESRFVLELPPLFARSGHARDDFFVVAQWFPKLAKLESNGRFVSFPYHALGEFYADFADYTVRIHAPRDMQVVASGRRVGIRDAREQRVHTFEARHVHDVLFIATRGFVQTSERVDGVHVHYLAPRGYEGALVEHARVVRAGLAHFGRAYGRYPYADLTLVVPPRGGDGAAGMEYPTLFVSEGEWPRFAFLPSLFGPFVTAHELAHQWFQGLLASNEVELPVLDEGLTQWAALDLMRALYGPREGVAGVRFDRFEVARLFMSWPTPSTRAGRPAHTYGVSEYVASVYARASVALESIRRSYGRERFARALQTYAQRERFGHPDRAALERAFDESYGEGFAARVLGPLLFDGHTSAVQLASARTRRRGERYATTLRARRTGAVALPTAVALYDRAGRELARAPWPSEQESLELTLDTRQPVARVALDPDRALLMDGDVHDQVLDFYARPGRSLTARVVAATQALLGWLGP